MNTDIAPSIIDFQPFANSSDICDIYEHDVWCHRGSGWWLLVALSLSTAAKASLTQVIEDWQHSIE
jgi:hypothetical protein